MWRSRWASKSKGQSGRSSDFPTRKPTIHIVTFNYGKMGTADFNKTLGTYW